MAMYVLDRGRSAGKRESRVRFSRAKEIALHRGEYVGAFTKHVPVCRAQVQQYPFSRDGEARVLDGGREQHRPGGPGPEQLKHAPTGMQSCARLPLASPNFRATKFRRVDC